MNATNDAFVGGEIDLAGHVVVQTILVLGVHLALLDAVDQSVDFFLGQDVVICHGRETSLHDKSREVQIVHGRVAIELLHGRAHLGQRLVAHGLFAFARPKIGVGLVAE